MKTVIWVLCFWGLGFVPLSAQQRPLDSLIAVEKTYQKEDTMRATLLNDIARHYYSIDPQTGLQYADKAIALAEKLPDKKFLAGAYSAKGTNKMALADYSIALDYYQKALAINERIGNLQGSANNYNNIGLVYYFVFDYPRALEYYQKTLSLYEKIGNKSGMANSFGNMGNIYNELHDYPKAIEFYQKALAINEKSGNTQNVAGILVNIGNVYTQLSDFNRALEFKQKALAINEELGNQAQIANNLSNIGNVYTQLSNYHMALQYHQQALAINERIGDKKGIAANLAGIGAVYLLQRNYSQAAEFEQKALELAHSIDFWSIESETLLKLSKIYEATGQFDQAYAAYQQHIALRDSIDNVEKQKQVTEKSLQFEFNKKVDSLRQVQLLTDTKLNEQLLIAAKQQQELILKQNAVDLAQKQKELQHLAYLKAQADLQYEQSQNRAKEEQLVLAEKEQKLQSTQVNLQQTQLQLKDRELQSQKKQRLYYLGGIVLLALLSFFIFRSYRIQQRSTWIIRLEKQKSDDLLRNILPREVAEELKERGETEAKQFNAVTVLFTDFVDFTQASEQQTPEQLVSELHACFKAFDEIMDRYGMEKIKTIGDAYMAVSGLPASDARHAQKAARAALDIQQFIRQRQLTRPETFAIRIGLHSGPVVAGIVGVKKFAYDIWGDTVNTAARMESTSEAGKINISGATYALLKAEFTCVYRGKITAKNKGEIDMYFLES